MEEFRLHPAEEQKPPPVDPYDRWFTTDGELAMLFYRLDDGILLRFPGRADFVIALPDMRVTCTPVDDVPYQVLLDLFYNQVMPLIMNHDGELVLHASAISWQEKALAFVGPSGRGKSTLAASFASAGHPFLTDDGLLLKRAGRGYTVNPNRPYLRLWSDSAEAVFNRSAFCAAGTGDYKTLVDSGPLLPFQSDPVELQAIYISGAGISNRVTIERLKPSVALSALINHSFILDVEDRPRLRAHFGRVASFAEATACFSLDYPRRYEELPVVMAAILDHAQSGELTS